MGIWTAGTNVLDATYAQMGQALAAALQHLIPAGRADALGLDAYIANNAVINIKDVGAVGDGVMDDSVKIIEAYTAARTGQRPFSIVRWPSTPGGVYRTTQSIPFDPYTITVFDAADAVTLSTSASIAFVPRTKASAATVSAKFYYPNVVYSGVPMAAGTIGIDLTGCSHAHIISPTIRNCEKGIYGVQANGGGYYNKILGAQITSCGIGIDLGLAANAYTILGGRMFGCVTAGIRLADCVTNLVLGLALEQCGHGIRLMSGARQNTLIGCHVEGSIAGGVLADAGSLYNLLCNAYSNPSDRPIDNSGLNLDLSPVVYGINAPESHIGGRNLVTNGDFTTDSGAPAGLATGITVPGGVAAGTSYALDGAVTFSGSGTSQRITIDAAGTSQRDHVITVPVTPGVPHVFTGKIRADDTDTWGVKIGNTVADSTYMSEVLTTADEWQRFRQIFVPTGNTVAVYVFQRSWGPGAARNVWFDEFQVQRGLIPTAFQG